MSYAKLIDRNLALTFNQLKDLAKEVVFLSNQVEEFDFSTSEPSVNEAPGKKVKAVCLGEKKKGKTRVQQLLFKSKDLTEVSEFDKVTIDQEDWSLGPVVHQRQYITLLDVFKEA